MSQPRRAGSSQRLTASMAATIKRLWNETQMPQHEIAALLGLNQGRVSEVISGVRFADVAAEVTEH